MLQQTRVEAVKPYFERFLEALPDISALAAVEDDRLMKLWEGLDITIGPQYSRSMRSRWLSSMAVSFRNHMKKSMH